MSGQRAVSEPGGLGGCGIHNAMLYMRGRPDDFSNGTAWFDAGWDWPTVLEAPTVWHVGGSGLLPLGSGA